MSKMRIIAACVLAVGVTLSVAAAAGTVAVAAAGTSRGPVGHGPSGHRTIGHGPTVHVPIIIDHFAPPQGRAQAGALAVVRPSTGEHIIAIAGGRPIAGNASHSRPRPFYFHRYGERRYHGWGGSGYFAAFGVPLVGYGYVSPYGPCGWVHIGRTGSSTRWRAASLSCVPG